MLNRLFLISLLLAPSATWAACTGKKEGSLSLDCSAVGPALNNPAVSGVTLLPPSGTAERSTPVKMVRPHEILNMGEQVGGAKANTPKNTTSAPGTPDSSTTAKPK